MSWLAIALLFVTCCAWALLFLSFYWAGVVTYYGYLRRYEHGRVHAAVDALLWPYGLGVMAAAWAFEGKS